MNLSPFARELVLHLVAAAPLHHSVSAHARLIGVLADQIDQLTDAPLRLPMPADPRAVEVASALLEDCADPRSIGELSTAAGASRRTIERLFVRDTGMSVGRWRTQARILEAVRRLSTGTSVTRVAADVGYSTPSAFGVAFRQVLGTSPGVVLRTLGDAAGRSAGGTPGPGR